MALTDELSKYRIGRCIAENAKYRVYLCAKSKSKYLLQITTDVESNGELDRSAYILGQLKATSDDYDKQAGKELHYEWLFPLLKESFTSEAQGDRRVNILTFSDPGIVNRIIPLSVLKEQHKVRISLETSGWILGRLLKLVDFIHGQSISLDIHADNILIWPEEKYDPNDKSTHKHHAVVFDWSLAKTYPNEVPEDIRAQNIREATKAVFTAIGGDVRNGEYVYEENDYVDMLRELIGTKEGNAAQAHADFYKVLHRVYGKRFCPFRTYKID